MASQRSQLSEVVHDLALNLNNRSQTDMILLDFSKAFDCVSHVKLVAKLEATIGDGQVTAWTKNFLSHRIQHVILDSTPSRSVAVTSGVPQGSVLGPLLFLIFINYITANIECDIKLFADDCIIYKEIVSYEDHLLLNRALDLVSNWCKEWQMSINTTKSVCMSFTTKKKPSEFVYALGGTCLNKVNNHKYT